MKTTRLISLLLACHLLVVLAQGQTATWIGQDNLATYGDWGNSANWDTGVVPNSPAATAIITNSDVASSYPTGGIRIYSTSVDLAELRLTTSVTSNQNSWAQRVVVTGPLSFPPSGGTLNLHGTGITTANSAGADPRYNLSVGMGSHLNFYNSATVASSSVNIGFDSPYSGFPGTVDFYDQSSAGSAFIFMQGSGVGSITFHDRSSAGVATLEADNLTFADQADAGNAHITTYAYGSTVAFRDQASAGNATISLTRYGTVSFADQADAGTATVLCSLESGGVFIRDQAGTAGLTIASITKPGETAQGGRLDISGATGAVTVRGLDGGVQVNLGANTLTLGPATGDQKLGGAITGTGGLIFDTGCGVRITRSDNTYTGPTVVRSGSLHLVSGRVSSTTVAAQAALTGTGTIAGDLLNHGSVRPATPLGLPLTVQGNFTQTATGTLAVQLRSPDNIDRLVVGGTATLDGALNLTFTGNPVALGNQRYTFLTAGSRTGTFSSVTGIPADTAMLRYHLAYSSGDAALEVTQQPFAGVGATPSLQALGNHLDATLATAAGHYHDILLQLDGYTTAADVTAALASLAPDRYATLAEEGFTTAAAHTAALDRRLGASRRRTAPGLSLFFEVDHHQADFATTAGLPRAKSAFSGGTAGGAWANGSFSAGVAINHETGSTDLDDRGSRADRHSLTPEIFIQYSPGPFFLNASVALAHDDYELRRRIVYSGFDQTATASPTGHRTDLSLTAGYGLPANGWTFTPFVGLLSSSWHMDDFTETGAAGASLSFTDWSNRSQRSRAGFEISRRPGSGAFTPSLNMSWLHEFGDHRDLHARFVGATGAGYSAPGRPAETDLVQASLSLEWRIGRNATTEVNLGGGWNRNSRTSSDLTVGFRWEF